MRESTIEKRLTDGMKKLHGVARKFVSPGHRGVTDRICMRPVADDEHRAILARYLRFVEVKAPGKTLEPLQEYECQKLRRMGFTVDVVSSMEEVEALLEGFARG